MTKFLFMGGPWHTRTYEVPDGSHTVRIPMVNAPINTMSWSSTYATVDTNIAYAEYYLARFAWTDKFGIPHIKVYYQYVFPKK